MHFICRSFIGKNNSNWWSQYWENEPDDQLKLTKGHLFGLINIQSPSFPDQNNIGHDLISEINQLYFSQNLSDVNQNLKNTLISISKNPIFSNYQLSLVLLVVINQQSFLATYGEGKIILQRGSQISLILSGLPNQIFSIFGPIQEKDRFLLTSQDFFEKISWDKIKNILIDNQIQNIEENFLSTLYSFENQEHLSAVLIETHQDSESIIEISPPISPKLDTPIPNLQLPSSPIYVQHRVNFKIGSHKKNQILVAFLLIIGLAVSSFFGYQKNQQAKAKSSFQSQKTELEKKLNNISVVKSLNLETAYQTAKEAQEIIKNMSNLNINPDEISQYKSQIDSILSQTGDSDSLNLESIYDTSLILNKPSFSKIIFSKSVLYLLDSVNGRIDSFTPQEKSIKNISISDEIKSAQKILVDNNNIYIFSDNQIKLVEKDIISPKLNLNDVGSIKVTDVQFWNSSVYIIDNSSQSIWKFTPNASGFSSAQSWLKNNAKLEIGSNSLAIDGQVWVLTESGLITSYLSGVKDDFKPKQTFDFTKAFSLIANPDSDFLVFIDDSKFIYVFKKKGEFNSKYNLGQLKVLDLSFDSANKIIYFLASDQKIYQITL